MDKIEKFFAFVIFVAIISSLIFAPFWLWDKMEESNRIEKEWRQKVNACLIDRNCRKDCDLILYRDAQIHNQKVDSHNKNSAVSAGIIGGVVGASMVRR